METIASVFLAHLFFIHACLLSTLCRWHWKCFKTELFRNNIREVQSLFWKMTDSIHQEHTTNFSIIISSFTLILFMFSPSQLLTSKLRISKTWKVVVVPSQAILHLNNTKTYFFSPTDSIIIWKWWFWWWHNYCSCSSRSEMGDFVVLLLLFMAFFMAMFGLLGRWRRITLFTMCKRLTGFRAPHLPTIIHYKVCKPKRLFLHFSINQLSWYGLVKSAIQ